MFAQHSLSSVFKEQQQQQQQQVSGPVGAIPQYGMPVRFNPMIGFLLAALFTACFFMGSFCVYVKRCCSRRRTEPPNAALPLFSNLTGVSAAPMHGIQRGLDKETIQSLPIIAFSPEKCCQQGKSATECSVCLTDFRSDEALKILPSCAHFFHPECIDMWLFSNSTCPLCRSILVPIKCSFQPEWSSRQDQILNPVPGEISITITEEELSTVDEHGEQTVHRDFTEELSGAKEEPVEKMVSPSRPKLVRTYLHRSSSSPTMVPESEKIADSGTEGNNSVEESPTCHRLRRATSSVAI